MHHNGLQSTFGHLRPRLDRILLQLLSALSFLGDSNDHADPQACNKEIENIRTQLNALRKEYVYIEPKASFLSILISI